MSRIPTSREQGGRPEFQDTGAGQSPDQSPVSREAGNAKSRWLDFILETDDARAVPGQETMSEFLTAVDKPRSQRARWFYAI